MRESVVTTRQDGERRSEKRLQCLLSRPLGVPLDYSIRAFEKAIIEQGVRAFDNGWFPLSTAGRVMKKLGMIRRFSDISNTAYITPMMQIAEERVFQLCYIAETIVYVFDCWEPAYDHWEAFFRRHKTRIAFISARASAEQMAKRVPGWKPYGCRKPSIAHRTPQTYRSSNEQ